MARPEYKDAPRVFVVVDNGSDHRGQAAIDRLRKAHPNAIMIHTRACLLAESNQRAMAAPVLRGQRQPGQRPDRPVRAQQLLGGVAERDRQAVLRVLRRFRANATIEEMP